MHVKTLLIISMAIASQSIFLSVKPKIPRCMVEYITTSGEEPTMKVMISFPLLQDQVEQEHFYVTLRNTETNKTETSINKPGTKYHKQSEFEPNVLYEICVNFRTDRKTEALVQFQSQRKFLGVDTQPIVPAHLLKKSDFADSYIAAAHIVQTIEMYTQEHNSRKGEEYKAFAITQNVSQNLTILSTIEMIVLIGAGCYQFFMLKNYLESKQYI